MYSTGDLKLSEEGECQNQVDCFNSIHTSYTACEDKHGNDIVIYNCIDDVLREVGDCKNCLCQLIPTLYLCQGGNIMQHHGWKQWSDTDYQ